MSEARTYHPISDVLRSALWRVDSYAVKIMRQDDPVKVRRLIREYTKASDNLLAVARSERETRLAATPVRASEGDDAGVV